MRREFAIQLESSVPGFQILRGNVRIDGDVKPGGTVVVTARVPNDATDFIPDKLGEWQNPKTYQVGADGFVRVEVKKSWGNLKVRAKVLTHNGTEYFVGDGSGTLLGMKHTLKITKSKRTLFEDTPETVPVTGKWAAKEVHSLSKVYKFKTILAVGSDVITTSYNRETRRYSAIDRLRGGVKTMIWEANDARGQSAETIGGGVRRGDTVYFIPEKSKHILKLDVPSGKVSKGAVIPHPYAVEACVWGDRVVYGTSNEGGSVTAIYDASDSKKLLDSPLKGLISALASDGNDLWWVVAGVGVCNSKGQSWPLKAASIAIWRGLPYVGSQDNGNLYCLDGDRWLVKQLFGVSKINRLVVDTRDNCLLIAGANPDTFLRMLPAGPVETLGRWTDQGIAVSGEQFDTYINEGPGNTILGSRALAAGCKAYQFSLVGSTPAPDPVTPPPPVEKPDLTPSKCKILWKGKDDQGDGTVILFPKQLVKAAGGAVLVTGGKSYPTSTEAPYEDGRGAYRYRHKRFPGPGTFTMTIKTGGSLVYAIPDCYGRYDGVTPKVVA